MPHEQPNRKGRYEPNLRRRHAPDHPRVLPLHDRFWLRSWQLSLRSVMPPLDMCRGFSWSQGQLLARTPALSAGTTLRAAGPRARSALPELSQIRVSGWFVGLCEMLVLRGRSRSTPVCKAEVQSLDRQPPNPLFLILACPVSVGCCFTTLLAAQRE